MREKYPIPPQGHWVQTRFGLRELLLCLFFALLIAPTVLAQSRVVTGKVSDVKDNTPLPGVSVLVKGSERGTVTDGDGKYSVQVDDGAVLIFSFIGFANQEIPVGAQSIIDIVLKEDAKQLSDVVVIGYGEQKKENLTGAVASIDPKSYG